MQTYENKIGINIEQNVYLTLKNSELFNEEYFRDNLNINDNQQDAILEFITQGGKKFVAPSEYFDAEKYLSVNHDVYYSGINPLYHYLNYGRFELRKQYRINDIFDENTEYQNKIASAQEFENVIYKNKRVAIFASYSKEYKINDYIIYYLESLRIVCDLILFVSDNYYPPRELEKIIHLIDGYHCLRHEQYDFGSYKLGYDILNENNVLDNIDELILCNDSVYGPVYPFEKLFESMAKKKCDFWGISNSYIINEHIQGYFMVLKHKIVTNKKFRAFFDRLRTGMTQYEVIIEVETEFTKYLLNLGYNYGVLIDEHILNVHPDHNSENHQVRMLENYSPFIKRKKVNYFWQNYDGFFLLFSKVTALNNSLARVIKNDHSVDVDIDGIKFSIILPTYNRGDCVVNAIDSVLKQTYRNYELLIIDDGSTDNTESIIMNKYQNEIEERKIIYVKCPRNKGAAFARNIGLKNSSNEWVCYLDSDNILEDIYLEYFALAIKNFPDHKIFYAKFIRYPENKIIGEEFSYPKLIKYNYIDLGVFVHHRKLINKYGLFDINLNRLIDYDLILRYTKDEIPKFINTSLLKYNNYSRKTRITYSGNIEDATYYIKTKHNDVVITTIIPSYRHEEYIQPALESALMQNGDYRHEILVSDDGSSDGTRKIIEKYVKKYPHIVKDLSTPNNVGLTQNFIRCIKRVAGDYIAFLEGDDYWIDPYKLQKQLSFMEHNPDCKMCFTGSYILKDETKQLVVPQRQKNLNKKFHMETLANISNPFITFSSTFYDTRILKITPNILLYPRLSEYALAFHFSDYGQIGFIEDKCTIYRMHKDSLWTGKPKKEKLRESIMIYQNIKKLHPDKYGKFLDKIIQEKNCELDTIKE